MAIKLSLPDIQELKPRILVCGVGGAGGNAVNNMITSGLEGVDFLVANTDAQALSMSKAERIIQLGVNATEGLGAGSHPEVGEAAAEEVIDEIRDHLAGSHMIFITAGMGGGTGTGAAPVVAKAARELGILTVGVVTKPFQFEGKRRMHLADGGIEELKKFVDTLIVIPNQNLFRVANEQTTFSDAFSMADQVLYSGVACITDLMVKEGLINLDFADVRSVMRDGGKAMMGTGEASGENRAIEAAESAIANPLLDDVSMMGAGGALVSISGGRDLRLYEVDEAANRIREEVDSEANIIVGATFDDALEGTMRVSVVATGVDVEVMHNDMPLGNIQIPTHTPNMGWTAALQNIQPSVQTPARVQNINIDISDNNETKGNMAASSVEKEMQTPEEPAQSLFTAPIEENIPAKEPEAVEGNIAIRRLQPDTREFTQAPIAQAKPENLENAAPKRSAPFIPAPTMRPHNKNPQMQAQTKRMPTHEDFQNQPAPQNRPAMDMTSPVEMEKKRVGFFDRIAEMNRQKRLMKEREDAQNTAHQQNEDFQKIAQHKSKVEQTAQEMAQHIQEQRSTKDNEAARAQPQNQPQYMHGYGQEATARPIDLDPEQDIPAFLRQR